VLIRVRFSRNVGVPAEIDEKLFKVKFFDLD